MERRRGRRRSDCPGPRIVDPLSLPVEPLGEMVSALSERGRLAMLAIDVRSDEVEVKASSGPLRLPAGARGRAPGLSWLLAQVESGEALVVDVGNGLLGPGLKELLERFEYRKALLVPVFSGDCLVGSVLIDEPGNLRGFDDRERRLLAAAVQQAGFMVRNAELREEAASRQRVLEAVTHLGVVLSSILDVDEAASQVVQYGGILLGLPAFMLLYRREEAARFEVLAAEGVDGWTALDSLSPIDASSIDLTAAEGESLSLEQLRGVRLFDELERRRFKTAVIASLREGDKLRGLIVGLDRREIQLPEQLLVAFRLLALQAGSVISNGERHLSERRTKDALREELGRSRTLQEAAVAATASESVEHSAEGLLQALKANVGLKAGGVFLAEGAQLRLLSVFGVPEQSVQMLRRVHIDDARFLSARASRERRVLTHQDESPLPQRSRDLSTAGLLGDRYVGLPIERGGALLGALFLAFEGKRPFSERELTLFRTVADIAAQSFENLRAFEVEHHIASTLQKALLIVPERVPGIELRHLYRSATEAAHVGGDFYDVFELDDERLCIVIGDVSGKGVEATSLTMVTRNAIRAYAYGGASPAEVMRRANDMVERMSEVSSFVTVFIGMVDVARRQMEYCNAGHPPCLVRRGDGKVDELLTGSPFLGALPQVEFSEARTSLAPGDLAFLYTDGVLEARRDGEFFGEARLRDLLEGCETPSEAVDGVFGAVDEFARGQLADDLALLSFSLQA